ncbi:Adenine/guanine permease AZG1 [Platanthera guangdongensis]|uniref:Adenine/guanine permease AZG1 n=1 Tax=Platanthera guangdongensis TaxID=2320717 RepID=A0ABR2LCB8_9ASPA
MGFFANLPIALGPGMGTNAYFAYSVVGFHGSSRVPYNSARAAIFLKDLLILLSIFGDIEKAWAGAKAIGSEPDGECEGGFRFPAGSSESAEQKTSSITDDLGCGWIQIAGREDEKKTQQVISIWV